ncbi:hypothetical protein Z950_3197 [Sulfitobacter mediterraneus KCTC 32188]|nr:hypothetical protein Z950_3197 [Sulfitobacter mediterraneus KCTC 32188]
MLSRACLCEDHATMGAMPGKGRGAPTPFQALCGNRQVSTAARAV